MAKKKAAILRHLNMRAAKTAFYSVVCRLPALRRYLNYYQDTIGLADAAVGGSVRIVEIDPVNDYGIGFSEPEIRDLLRCKDVSADSLRLGYEMARLADVTLLGSSGVTLDNRTGRVLAPGVSQGPLHPNWVVARPLKPVPGDHSAAHVNLLWMRKGHRHFAHFFWDVLLPVLVFLRNWPDRDEPLVFVVREDQSAIQRDTWRFLAEDYPNLAIRPLGAGQKLVCDRAVHIAGRHGFYGVANTLAREYMRAMADFYLRHYGVGTPSAGPGKRLYLSREGAAIRKVTNEPAVIDMLSRHGFDAVEPAGVPFRQQAGLFRSADVVVAPHGAALANLMFCRPGTRVLEFFPADFVDDCYLRISKSMELRYHYLFGGKSEFPKRNYEMAPDELERALLPLIET